MESRRVSELPSVEDAVVQELARRVVSRVAPEEGEIFDIVRDAYRRDPQRLTSPGGGRDQMLGFGVEAAAALLTPLALGISAEVVRHLTMEAVGAIEVGDRLRGLLRRRRDADPADGQATPAPHTGDPEAAPAASPAPAPPADHARIREIVLTRCRQAGVDDDRAGLIADAVVGALHHDG
ncbi:hypothetical protein [Micromonospora thermarum]|uniref:Uncharacterized protein n=1 Tax=Micromonospora thermarum TaxID=2720024 RepID=A0ABX0ZFJ5_9ACTN|nr:hypothetical protein [Micromonospora thermarum]NJP35329.1 hypothetical protein [Micromonospora thermarum]